MKIFYDQDGNVAGYVKGVSLSIENNISIPNTDSYQVPLGLAKQVRNPKNPLQPRHLKVKSGKIVEMSPKEKEKADDAYRERNQQFANNNRETRREARREETGR